MLVGNKCDLENIREVSIEEGKSLAEAEGLFFMETSALDSTNVQAAFEIVIREIYNNISRKVLNSDSYKAELSVNRVSLVNGAGSKQSRFNFSCCSWWGFFSIDLEWFYTSLHLSRVVCGSILLFFLFLFGVFFPSYGGYYFLAFFVSFFISFSKFEFLGALSQPFGKRRKEMKRNGKCFALPWIC